MRRLGIFVFYDANGKADAYIKKLLDGIIPLFERLIIVVNGVADEDTSALFRRYSEDIFLRQNIGFDGGAYKDVLCKYLKYEEWKQFDEIVLFNDTFYGPVHPFAPVFEKMEGHNPDFWGLTRHPECVIGEMEIKAHIQSYFLVIGKRVLESDVFKAFWEEMVYPKSFWDAVLCFEVRFTQLLEENGFSGKCYIDVCGTSDYILPGKNPTVSKVYELVCNLSFPIVKRKSLCPENFAAAKKVMEYIDVNTEYDCKLIANNLQRLSREKNALNYNPVELERFLCGHRKIYFYGNGEWSRNLRAYFEHRGWNYEGVIVSENSGGDNVTEYKDFHMSGGDGIILALGRKAFLEVYPLLTESIKPEDIFVPKSFRG